jgi:hypothetical protein
MAACLNHLRIAHAPVVIYRELKLHHSLKSLLERRGRILGRRVLRHLWRNDIRDLLFIRDRCLVSWLLSRSFP